MKRTTKTKPMKTNEKDKRKERKRTIEKKQ